MLNVPLPNRRATIQLGRAIAMSLEPKALLILSGSLGAGKTFLTRAILRALGLPGHTAVTSPTFTLVQDYALDPPLLHADLYRLHNPEAVLDLGLDVARDQGAVLIAEWGEAYLAELGGDGLMLALQRGLSGERQAVLSSTGAHSQELLERIRRSSAEFISSRRLRAANDKS